MIKKILFMLLAILISLIGVYSYGYWSATRLPDASPVAFLSSETAEREKVVVCIGDSITHGHVSHNYVADLSKQFPIDRYSFINAGVNSELAYNVLQRLDGIIRCKPDYVTLMIGTNDALATLNTKNAERYIKDMNLPQKPDIQWYRKNLEAIVNRLLTETNARIALLSLPPITEDETHPGFQRSIEYSAVVQQIAMEKSLTYLPLNETMTSKIQQTPQPNKSHYQGGDNKEMYLAIFSYYLLGWSWDEIADQNGFRYLTDSIHLNRRGAAVVADQITQFLSQ